ncbi:helix-turn-helix domain-containing protein [Candidatus Uhrbacteria bacterium]|nr:helix-turn-helix domain-containing protein [Candidatus Uhrbacteria bacterium]
MLVLNLKSIAERLGKSISDIARETGLNRNTITALYHGKVDGIKFETLEKLMLTYHLSLSDLVSQESTAPPRSHLPSRVYKQEGDVVPFTLWWPFAVANNLPQEFFDSSYGELSCYHKRETGYVYLDAAKMHTLAESSYRRYSKPKEFQILWSAYLQSASRMEEQYRSVASEQMGSVSQEQLVRSLDALATAYHAFWKMSIFIDSFDAGFDSAEIDRITHQYGITKEDASVLASPAEHTFNAERQIAALQVAKKYLRRKIFSLAELRKDASVLEYKTSFDWYKTNYAFANHISFEEIFDEIHQALSSPKKLSQDLEHLLSAPLRHKRRVSRILQTYGLKKNPLRFFQSLTYWREHRKKTNLMGIQALYALLDEVERRTGISGKHLKFLLPSEFEQCLRGAITQEMLRSRYEKGILLTIKNKDEYRMFMGEEAASLRDEYESILKKDSGSHDGVLYGTVASQGYARGVARIVLGREDFDAFQEGEILVTGMTRPEFLPVIKIAAGIVTNEGGLTSHAAIVSRELGKPCVIGTKRATTAIKNGDVVEVRAHHGTVRIVQRA